MDILIEKLKKVEDTIEEYHSKDSISASGLKAIHNKSVYHYLNKEEFKSKAMYLGIAVHTLFYEGLDAFSKQYFVLPKLDLRKKDDKLLKESLMNANQGKTPISNEEYRAIIGIYDNHLKNDVSVAYSKGEIEVSHYGQLHDIEVRVRPDCIGEGWISDVKTCQDASPKAFKRDLYKYAYHLQATFYCRMLGINPKNFRFIACETQYPYQVQVYSMSDDMIEYGDAAWKRAFYFWELYKVDNILTSYTGTLNDDKSIIL